MHNEHENTVLFLVGDGELKADIENKAAEYGINDSVIFTGVRKDVPALLSAMDIFTFPSLYEGMPNVLIEAQASGLKCVVSDTITSQVVLTPQIMQLSLGDIQGWVIELNKYISQIRQIKNEITASRREQCLPKEYDIREVVRSFVSYLI